MYRACFFEKIKSLLNNGGVFAIWSCNYDEDLLQETRKVFDDCRVDKVVEEHSGRQVPYYIYFCNKG